MIWEKKKKAKGDKIYFLCSTLWFVSMKSAPVSHGYNFISPLLNQESPSDPLISFWESPGPEAYYSPERSQTKTRFNIFYRVVWAGQLKVTMSVFAFFLTITHNHSVESWKYISINISLSLQQETTPHRLPLVYGSPTFLDYIKSRKLFERY